MAAPPTLNDALWARLRAATPARIGLPRAGSSIATSALLAFQRAHAAARDAVHDTLDAAGLAEGLRQRGVSPLTLRSAANARAVYLARPDLGRRLDDELRALVEAHAQDCDIVFVLADGLSARATTTHALPLLDCVLPSLRASGWRIGPAAIVLQGRVAIADEIGHAIGAKLVVALIGERPGLTSPDSLGAYITFAPALERTDAERNCLSNIRSEGMSYEEAGRRLAYLCVEARRRKLTGVMLKDETPEPAIAIERSPSPEGPRLR